MINRSLWAFGKHLCVDANSIALIVGMVYYVLGPIQELHAITYFGWSILALKTIALGIPAIATVNTVFYYPKITRYIKKQ